MTKVNNGGVDPSFNYRPDDPKPKTAKPDEPAPKPDSGDINNPPSGGKEPQGVEDDSIQFMTPSRPEDPEWHPSSLPWTEPILGPNGNVVI